MEKKKCDRCGKKNRHGKKRYCQKCGYEVLSDMAQSGYLQTLPRWAPYRGPDAKENIYETKFGPRER